MSRRNSWFALLLILISGFSSLESRATVSSPGQSSGQTNEELLALEQKANAEKLFAQADQIVGLEAVVASGDDGAFYSRFGHAMLRFVKSDGNYATDSVVSMVADVGDQPIDAIKGTFGGYRVLPVIEPFGAFWDEYVKTEERSLSRYIIISTPAMRQKLLEILKAWLKDPSQAGSYTFLDNNCVGALSRLFEKAGLSLYSGIDPKVPLHFDTWLKRSLLSPYPGLQVKSAKPLFDAMAVQLGISAQHVQSGEAWPQNAADTLLANFNDLEVKQMLLQLTQMPRAVRSKLLQEHHYGNGGANLEEVLTFKVIPEALYGICSDSSCISHQLDLAQSVWTAAEWKDALREDDFSFWLAQGRPDPQGSELSFQAQRNLLAPSELLTHYALLFHQNP